jgi:CRP-like cAMP-binding protein
VARVVATRMDKDWAAVLADVPLFSGLSKRQLGKVAKLAALRTVPPYTQIVRAGGRGDAFYVIISGKAVVRRQGRRSVTLEPGDFFGELALLDGAPRSATVEAAEQVELMHVPRSGFTKLLRTDASIACAMLETLAGRMREAQSSPNA